MPRSRRRQVPRKERAITREEARRAIYVDFEGFADQPPSLLGRACESEIRQIVLDPRLRAVAAGKGLRVASLKPVVEELLEECRRDDRVIVGFTQREKQAIAEHAGLDVSPYYRDAHKVARRWVNRVHPETEISFDLASFLDFIGYERPRHLGNGNATARLRAVLNGLEARGSFEALTPVQKGKWTKLLDYNQFDCCGTRELTLRAAAELERARSGP